MDAKENGADSCESKVDFSSFGLSARTLESLEGEPEIMGIFAKVGGNKYDPVTNPEGIISFGVAENMVAVDILRPKLEAISSAPDEKRVYSYGLEEGEMDFRETMKRFLHRKFYPREDLDVNTLFVLSGMTTALEHLAFAFAQPGEYIMVPLPCYFRLQYDFSERAKVLTLPVEQPMPSEENGNRYAADVVAMETALQKAKREGKVVRAIHITNPNNPTGDMYTAEELTEILNFAHRHKLHVIANELYGMSVYDPEATFTSILSLPHPDPERVHFLWGFSKDFGLPGFRVSVMYTKNPGLAQFIIQMCPYTAPLSVVQAKLRQLLDDEGYIDKEFLPEIRRTMLARYQNVKEVVEGCGGRVHPSPATIFRWLDLSPFLPSADWAGERELLDRLLSGGVYLVAGRYLDHREPGWFRMVAAKEEALHTEGLRRIVKVLNAIRSEQRQQQQ